MFKPTSDKAIAYYRVSTAKQGESGLGLEAQQASVQRFCEQRGLRIVGEYTEVETGTSKKRRVEIHKAISAARERGAVLLIAKLDRLARNVAFISALQEAAVDFAAVDMPDANTMTIQILAAVAEQEARLISERTKAALDAKRERVGEWRVSNLTQDARERGAAAMHEQAVKESQSAAYAARLLRQSGLSYAKIAEELNTNGYTTRRGRKFQAMTVKRILDRVGVE